ncbi:hypothetical protein T484DRAFT_2026861 [Baffinella frigidus]|nr:hypothetical protein T484DRAFT_2026861 [Cryptophyta sp. CCMP2293]
MARMKFTEMLNCARAVSEAAYAKAVQAATTVPPLTASAPPLAVEIDPDLLKTCVPEYICGICSCLLDEPTSACEEGHCYCKACYVRTITGTGAGKNRCPACRSMVHHADFVRNRLLEAIMQRETLSCENSRNIPTWAAAAAAAAASTSCVVAAGSAKRAKRAKVAPFGTMSIEDLRTEAAFHARSATGDAGGVVHNPSRSTASRDTLSKQLLQGCTWQGTVADYPLHAVQCGWSKVKCSLFNCTFSTMYLFELDKHHATCVRTPATCTWCHTTATRHTLWQHEELCAWRECKCPNEKCTFVGANGTMNIHRNSCRFETIHCGVVGCNIDFARNDIRQHMEQHHPALLPWGVVSDVTQQLAVAAKTLHSEQRFAMQPHAPTVVKSWVLNWAAAGGWDGGTFPSRHFHNDTAFCQLEPGRVPYSHRIKIVMNKPNDQYKLHVSFDVLGTDDKIVHHIGDFATATAPRAPRFGKYPAFAVNFSPTTAQKKASLRADGSIRLRVFVTLSTDDDAP